MSSIEIDLRGSFNARLIGTVYGYHPIMTRLLKVKLLLSMDIMHYYCGGIMATLYHCLTTSTVLPSMVTHYQSYVLVIQDKDTDITGGYHQCQHIIRIMH